MSEIEILERRLADDPADARAMYQLAVLLEDARLSSPDRSDETDRRILERLRALLHSAISIEPKHARAHSLLAHTHDQLNQLEEALALFRKARTLDKRACVDVFVATMLVQLEREEDALTEIEELAKRRKVNLRKLRAESAKAHFPANAQHLLINGFIYARNFLISDLSREAERIRNALVQGRKERVDSAERDECAQFQSRLEKEFNAAMVPKALRPLAAAASRYGIGDDPCRAAIMKRVPKATRTRLIKAADRLATRVDKWLDSFGGGENMSVEAAAFMYLYEGVEEIRP